MRIPCPLCGTRDRREFHYYGSDDYLNRPAPDAPIEAWDDHLHLRDNPAGETRDLWYHETGCAQWLRVLARGFAVECRTPDRNWNQSQLEEMLEQVDKSPHAQTRA